MTKSEFTDLLVIGVCLLVLGVILAWLSLTAV